MRVGGKVASHAEQSLVRAAQWLTDCENTHTNCILASKSVLPHRVINVASAKSPFLYESSRELGTYVALSHRWGDLQLLKTTKATLESRKRRIELSELSQTFRDAVLVTAKLGIRYLWIDSLCIIQDDPIDWQQESSMMASIYENAFVTLAANSNSSGLLSPRRSPCRTINFKLQAEVTASVSLRQPLPHGQFFDKPENFYRKKPTDYPLVPRAWCFQERALSRRVLNFTDEELVFECKQGCQCECAMISVRGSAFLKTYYHSVLKRGVSTKLWEGWAIIMQEYCKRELTSRRDFLPALAGVASKVQSEHLGKYLAGLWEQKLNPGLFWFVSYSSETWRPAKDVYIAPSFSWASLVGSSRLRTLQWSINLHLYRRQLFEVLEVYCKIDGRNPYGEVSDGFVRLRGPFLRGILDPGSLTINSVGQIRGKIGRVAYTIYLDDYDIDSFSSEPFLCLVSLCSFRSTSAFNSAASVGILLKQVSPSIFKRIGYFEANEDTSSWNEAYWEVSHWYRKLPAETITII